MGTVKSLWVTFDPLTRACFVCVAGDAGEGPSGEGQGGVGGGRKWGSGGQR